MDFGAVGFDNFLYSTNSANNGGFALENGTAAENNNKQQKWYAGSGFLKQERSINEDDNSLREFKMAKAANSCGETMLKIPFQRSNSSNLSIDGQQMLSFSSPNSQNPTLPYYHHTTSTAFSRNSGYGCTGINGSSMQGVLSAVRGPFTPSQWMELEHQALIYKYITANVPIPSSLLNPIRKAFESAGFSTFPPLRSNPLGWGGFHLGFSNSDPEPGRCRRTDGKKWRCSRDAVADQKYCERHMNRGRHRSRKPVEGQGNGAPATNTNAKLTSPTSSSTPVAVSNGLTLSHHHNLTNLQPPASAALPNINRSLLDKENPSVSYLKHQNPYEESSFGLVCSDSLLNPLNKSSSLVNCRNNHNNNNQENKSQQHSLRQFMDNWPKNQSESATWPDCDQSDGTHLSISIPIASSPPNGASPLRLPREQLEMGLGVGVTTVSDQHQRQTTNWVPISWEPSMGGPLGEVLHSTTGDCKNIAKPLNLIDSWDNSPRLASSPTGVLQRGAFTSFSNSSAGSSPRAESNGALIGPGLTHPSLPAL